MSKYKLVAFDLDGTIIDNVEHIWHTIHSSFPIDKSKREAYKKKYFAKEITYAKWAKLDVALWRTCNARHRDLMAAIKGIRLVKGARQTLRTLKKAGFKLALISGSLNIALEKVLPEYKEIFDYVLLNRLYFRKDGTILRIIPTKYDMEHKLTGLVHICKKEGISLQQTAFVGDHFNDIHIAREAGLSIAFCPNSKELEKVSHVVIRNKDIREVLKYIITS